MVNCRLINPQKKYIGISSIDKLNPLKRIPFLINVFEQIKMTNPDCELLILNNIPHNSMPDYINSCEIILLASIYEGWPNIIKEACACGVPFISTDVSDLKIFVKKIPNYSYVENCDVHKFSEKCFKILDLSFSNDLNARKVLRQSVSSFERKEVCKKLESFYNLQI